LYIRSSGFDLNKIHQKFVIVLKSSAINLDKNIEEGNLKLYNDTLAILITVADYGIERFSISQIRI